MPSLIMVVGSATKPQRYWDIKKASYELALFKGEKRDPPKSQYQEIDLRLVPEQEREGYDYREAIVKILEEQKMPWKPKKSTRLHIPTSPGPFQYYGYGSHSMTTLLPQNTEVDLIVQDNDKKYGPEFIILRDRRCHNSFSILHRPPKNLQSWSYYWKGVLTRGNANSFFLELMEKR